MKRNMLAALCLACGLASASDGAEKSGSIHAVVGVDANGAAAFVEPPSGGLPERALQQLEPAFLSRAKEVHAASKEDATYRMAIEWQLVANGEAEQLQFDYRTSDPRPLVVVEPQYPIRMLMPEDDIEVILRFRVLPDGSVEDVARAGGNPDKDFFVNARNAVRQWKFVPKYTDGIAVVREVELPMLFKSVENAKDDKTVYVNFRLDADGEPHAIEFQEPLPDCLDVEVLREEIKAAVRTSEAAAAIRRGAVAHREGQISFRLPPCPAVTGEAAEQVGQ